MDNKRTVILMLVAVALMLGWTLVTSTILKKHPDWAAPARSEPVTQPAMASDATVATAPLAVTLPTGASLSADAAGLAAAPSTQPSAVLLGSNAPSDPTYPMGVQLTSAGAGISSVTLNQFRASVDRQDLYAFQQPYADLGPGTVPLATTLAIVNGQPVSVAGNWSLVHQDAASATFEVTLADAGKPAVRIDKTFSVQSADGSKSAGQGYEIALRQSVTNLAAKPISVALQFNGPTAPPHEIERGQDRVSLGGYVSDNSIVLSHTAVESFTGSNQRIDMTHGPKNEPLAWAGLGGAYFNAIVRPDPMEGTSVAPIAKVEADGLNPAAPVEDRAVLMQFTSTAFDLAPGQTVTSPLRIFAGPKQRALLNSAYYADPPLSYNKTFEIYRSGPCGFCAFDWLINILVNLLRVFHFVTRDWGVAIICLVAVVRLCLHPITKRSQVQMARMQKMAPEMDRLKKKYADDPDALNKAMMQYYKEQGPAQLLGCAPMFLQMPIWIALYQSLQTTFEMRQAPFLWFGPVHLTWISDLAKPDRLVAFSSPIALPFGFHLAAINILPILLSVVFFLQQKFMPKPATMTPEQASQQKMMMFITPLIFPLMFYTGPAGLNLYILTSTTAGIIESKIVRNHIKEQEAREAGGVVVVDAPIDVDNPPRRTGEVRRAANQPTANPAGGLWGWFQRLQEKAEQLKQEQDRKNRGRR